MNAYYVVVEIDENTLEQSGRLYSEKEAVTIYHATIRECKSRKLTCKVIVYQNQYKLKEIDINAGSVSIA